MMMLPRYRRDATSHLPSYGHAFVTSSLKLWPFADPAEPCAARHWTELAMNSMPNPTATDPNDDLVARADKRLAHAYEQIARADEQLARVTENLSNLDRGAARKPAAVP